MSARTTPSFVMRRLRTPAIPRLVPDGVFDDFGWAESDVLDVRVGDPFDVASPSTSMNPAGMAFILRGETTWLPQELAHLHVGSLAGAHEWALAPYGIDDATDELWRQRARPHDRLLLATRSLDGLVWGLHDWCHFHNHGPFDSPAWTEVQCDASALVWLWLNRAAMGLEPAAWEARRTQLLSVARERFEAEGLAFDEALYGATPLLTLADTLGDAQPSLEVGVGGEPLAVALHELA